MERHSDVSRLVQHVEDPKPMKERLVEDDFLSNVYERIPSRTSFNQHPNDFCDIFGGRKLLPVIYPNIPWDDLHIYLH